MIPLDKYTEFAENLPILCVDAIIVKNGKYLLIKRKNAPLKNEWCVVGGRVLKDEKLEDAMKRKIQEEVGLDVEIVARLGFYEESFADNDLGIDSKHTVSVVFVANPKDNTQEIKLDDQSSDFMWADAVPQWFKNQVFKLGD
jgi:ADP-ribose pyrophosphatase YjhB (NUDIX family)|tara:strand:- start:1183 stop:1608 length:426 start_codon:yes stop_codon:yes gene_type:complete